MPAWPSTLPAPNRDGYTLNPAPAFIRTNMDGGKARQRKRFTSVPTSIPLQWLFTQQQLAIFEAWWKYQINLGTSTFTMQLYNGKGYNNYNVRFIKEYSAPVARGIYFYVSAQVEVFDMLTMSPTELQAYL